MSIESTSPRRGNHRSIPARRTVAWARWARVAAMALIVGLIAMSGLAKAGYGTLCSAGVGSVSMVCPLGFLQMAAARRSLLPQLWIPAGLAVLATILLGRVFCAWACPAALLHDLFGGRNRSDSRAGRHPKGNAGGDLQGASEPSSPGGAPWESRNRSVAGPPYAAFAILGGAVLSSLLFGFPVFCLVCPVGLFFGSVFALSTLFVDKQPTLELLLFPALLAGELFLLKRWCSSVCPLGALLTLVSKLNLTLRPTVRSDVCLHAKGIACKVCRNVCPEGIYPPLEKGGTAPSHCTKCLECYEKCPVGAIRLPWLTLPGWLGKSGKGTGREGSASGKAVAGTKLSEPTIQGPQGDRRD